MTSSTNPAPAPEESFANFRIASAQDVLFIWRKISHLVVQKLLRDEAAFYSKESAIQPDDAGEAVHRMFDGKLRKMEAGAPAEIIKNPVAFFTLAAKQEWIDILRERKRKACEKIGKGPTEVSPSTIASPMTPTPSKAADLREKLAVLEQAKTTLADDERELLELQSQQLTYAEMADRVGLTPQQVKDKLAGIRMNLRREMGRKYSDAWRHDHREEPFTTRDGAEKAIDRMLEECKGTLQLVHLQGLSIEAAAAQLGFTVDEGRRRLEKGVRLLLERHDMTIEEFHAALARTPDAKPPADGDR